MHLVLNKTFMKPIFLFLHCCIHVFLIMDLLRLTLRLGVIVVEVLLPLCRSELAHVPKKQIFSVVTAEPIWTKGEWEEFINNSK